MDRRLFLTMLAAGASAMLAGCTPAGGATVPGTAVPGEPATQPTTTGMRPPPPASARTVIPAGTITALPGEGANLALTVDDGADPDVVDAYIRFAQDTGARFTFFVTASYPAWSLHRPTLRPLVDSGQIQLANHTWDHPDLTTLSRSAVAEQLVKAQKFLRDNYGVDSTPYYRPPYGFHNPTVDAVAADLGYTVPTLWYGSLSDSSIVTEDYLLDCARRYFNAQAIVIGHANHPAVTHVYPQLVDIVKQRALSLVTLNDVLIPPRPPR